MVEHPLDKPGIATAFVFFGAFAGGIVVTQTFPNLFWAGIVICFGSAAFTVWRYWRSIVYALRRASTPAIPVWEASLVSFLVAVEIVGSTYLAAPAIAGKVSFISSYFRPSISIPFVRNPYDETVALQCGLSEYPMTPPFSVMEVAWQPNGGQLIGLGGQIGPVHWLGDKAPSTYKCVITNYGKEPIFKIAMTFHQEFREIITLKNGTRSGNIAGTQERKIYIGQIDTGKPNSFVFYVWNGSQQYFATVMLPYQVSFVSLGSDIRQNARLLLPGDLGLVLFPMDKITVPSSNHSRSKLNVVQHLQVDQGYTEQPGEAQSANEITKRVTSESNAQLDTELSANSSLSDLSVEQKRTLLDEVVALKTTIPNVVINRASSGNTTSLMMDFLDVFQRAGIRVVTGFEEPNGPNETGVMIAVPNLNDVPPSALKIRSALKKIGIEARLVVLPSDATQSSFVIFIGPQPLATSNERTAPSTPPCVVASYNQKSGVTACAVGTVEQGQPPHD